MARPKKLDKTSEKKQYSAPALSKGLDILELLSTQSAGLSLKNVGDKLDRSTSEIFRMLIILKERGYISTAPNSDNYVLTMKLFELAHRHPKVKLLANAAMPEIKSLVYAIKQSCHLVIHNQGGGLVVAQQDSPSEHGFSVRLGAETSLLDSCAGQILLAYAESDEQEQMLELLGNHLNQSIPKTKLNSLSKKITAQGFERVKSKLVRGVTEIGYPVFDYSGSVVAAIVVPYLELIDNSHVCDIDTVQKQLKSAAQAVSISLGYCEEDAYT